MLLEQTLGKSEQPDCFVVFSNYNAFVLRDVTLRSVVLNVSDGTAIPPSSVSITFGAGDWNGMSQLLRTANNTMTAPSAVPKDGFFDIVLDILLAAETTYMETEATETAALIARHLRPTTGWPLWQPSNIISE